MSPHQNSQTTEQTIPPWAINPLTTGGWQSTIQQTNPPAQMPPWLMPQTQTVAPSLTWTFPTISTTPQPLLTRIENQQTTSNFQTVTPSFAQQAINPVNGIQIIPTQTPLLNNVQQQFPSLNPQPTFMPQLPFNPRTTQTAFPTAPIVTRRTSFTTPANLPNRINPAFPTAPSLTTTNFPTAPVLTTLRFPTAPILTTALNRNPVTTPQTTFRMPMFTTATTTTHRFLPLTTTQRPFLPITTTTQRVLPTTQRPTTTVRLPTTNRFTVPIRTSATTRRAQGVTSTTERSTPERIERSTSSPSRNSVNALLEGIFSQLGGTFSKIGMGDVIGDKMRDNNNFLG